MSRLPSSGGNAGSHRPESDHQAANTPGSYNTERVLADVQNRLNSQGFILDQLGSSFQGQEDRLTTRFNTQLEKEREDLKNEFRVSMVNIMSDLAAIKDGLLSDTSPGQSQTPDRFNIRSVKQPMTNSMMSGSNNQPTFSLSKSEFVAPDSESRLRNKTVERNPVEEQSFMRDQLILMMSCLENLNTNVISGLESSSDIEKSHHNLKTEMKSTLKQTETNIVEKILQQSNQQMSGLCKEAMEHMIISVKEEMKHGFSKIKHEMLDQLRAKPNTQGNSQFGEIHRDMEKQLDIMRDVKSDLKGNFANISFVLRLLIFLLPVFLVLLPWAPVLSQSGVRSENNCPKFEQFVIDFEHITKEARIIPELHETVDKVKTSLDELSRVNMEGLKNSQPEEGSNLKGVIENTYSLFSDVMKDFDHIKLQIGTIVEESRRMLNQLQEFSIVVKDDVVTSLKDLDESMISNIEKFTKQLYQEWRQEKKETQLAAKEYLFNSNETFHQIQKIMNISLGHELLKLKSELVPTISSYIEKQNVLNDKSIPSGKTGVKYLLMPNNSDKKLHHKNRTFNASLEMRNELKDIRKELKSLRISLKSQIQSVVDSVKFGLDESTAILTETQTEFLTILQGDLDKHLQYMFRDLSEAMEKEGQLTRDSLHEADIYHHRNVYQFYFPVKLFKQRVKSGVWVISCPWFVHQFDTSVRGNVKFNTDGSLGVWMVFGRYPNRVGLLPKEPATFYYKVSVVDEDDNRERILGESPLGYLNEAGQKVRFDALAIDGWKLFCTELQDSGFVKLDTLVIKYVLIVKPSGISKEMLTPGPQETVDPIIEDLARGPVPAVQ